jgi:hypothetical protein
MTERGGPSRWLFRLACAAAALLVAAVVLAPRLDDGAAAPRGWRRLAAVFARDAALRRTSLASAAGLLVTACVFFQPGPTVPPRPRSSGVAGA